VPKGFQAIKFLHGAAVHAFGLGLIAQEQGKREGGFENSMKALSKEVATVLDFEDLIVLVDEVRAEANKRTVLGGEDFIEADGTQAAMQAFDAEEGLLGEGDALDGEEFLGVDGLVGGDSVLPEVGDVVLVFDTDDGKGGSGERVFAGVLGGAGLALRGARSGGLSGVGAVGGELIFGDGFPGTRHGVLRFER
jgi:hypothetical protein